MRIAYLGTGEIGLPTLNLLSADNTFQLCGIVTQPDRPAGRRQQLTSPPVKLWAEGKGFPVMQPESINDSKALGVMESWKPDLILVCAYGQILKAPLLSLPPLGCWNIHASLLPKHRGASCIHAALLAGDTRSGITLIQMNAGLDTGDILATEALDIYPEETASSLHDRLANLAPHVVRKALEHYVMGNLNALPQNDAEATYAPKLDREAGKIDWSQSAIEIARRIYALHNWPGSFTFYTDSHGKIKRLKIFPPVRIVSYQADSVTVPGTLITSDSTYAVQCGSGSLSLGSVQPEGSRVMDVGSWLRGGLIKGFQNG
ncbi:MAG: methionyl-tRNA formyltransferase [Candidatus Methylacidiphilales bacterium]